MAAEVDELPERRPRTPLPRARVHGCGARAGRRAPGVPARDPGRELCRGQLGLGLLPLLLGVVSRQRGRREAARPVDGGTHGIGTVERLDPQLQLRERGRRVGHRERLDACRYVLDAWISPVPAVVSCVVAASRRRAIASS